MTVIKMKSCFALAIAATLGLTNSVQATVITLTDDNSSAIFHTEAVDGGTLGQNSWTVDGVNHLAKRGLWFRSGGMNSEAPLNAINLVFEKSLDTDLDGNDDLLLVRYSNTGGAFIPGSFEIDLQYSLVGGSALSGNSSITQMVRVKNTGAVTLDFNLFDFADFNLANTPGNDVVTAPGGLGNTMRVNDFTADAVAETVATFAPTRFQVGDANTLLASLDDNDPTNLNDNVGPSGPGDAGWAYQWSYLIAPGQTVLISSVSNIQSIAIPEPSSLGLLAAGCLMLMRRRK